LKVLLSGIISFILAGAIAGIADIGLFALFSNVLLKSYVSLAINILISSVIARIFSSIINFIINRCVTFGGKNVSKKSVIKYYLLWCAQLFASYGLVLLLTMLIGGGEIIIKLIVDFVLSLLSYQVQMKWVFRKKDVGNEW
jgi:dolichol-phosphate mannosyltransferase